MESEELTITICNLLDETENRTFKEKSLERNPTPTKEK